MNGRILVMAKSAPAPSVPTPTATAPAAPVAAAPSAPAAPRPALTSGEQPTPDAVDPQTARLAFAKVVPFVAPDDKPAAKAGTPAKTESPAPGTTAAEQAGEETPLVYEDTGAEGAAHDGGAEETFTPPAWMEALPAELRPEAEKFARNQVEQTQKLKRQRGEAQAEKQKAEQERDAEKARSKELETAPAPVQAPELALPRIRTHAELDAFLAAAPKQLEEKQQTLGQWNVVLKGLEDDESFTAPWGTTYTAAQKAAVLEQAWKVHDEISQINADMQAGPQKRAWLDKRQPVLKLAAEKYPDLYKDGTPMAKARKALVEEAPSIEAHPKAPLIIGDHLIMEMVRKGVYKVVKASPAAPKAEVSNAPATAGSRDTAAPVPRTAGAADQAEAAALKKRADDGDDEALRQLRLRFARVAA